MSLTKWAITKLITPVDLDGKKEEGWFVLLGMYIWTKIVIPLNKAPAILLWTEFRYIGVPLVIMMERWDNQSQKVF